MAAAHHALLLNWCMMDPTDQANVQLKHPGQERERLHTVSLAKHVLLLGSLRVLELILSV